ncbi:MAG: hypothetical protein HQL69_15875 [Magnetococcales bacterium]|nr:hypothetical protein [Magnetococcales bacterium]
MSKKLILRATGKFEDLFAKIKGGCANYSPNGVVKYNDDIFVVFANCKQIARLAVFGPITKPLFSGKEWLTPVFDKGSKIEGFAGITCNRMKFNDDNLYTVVESIRRTKKKKSGKKKSWYNGKVVTIAKKLEAKESWLDYELPSKIKGFEGACVINDQEDNTLRMLAICEGNCCRTGIPSKIPGSGRIQVFKPEKGTWQHELQISLPDFVKFIDYSDLDVIANKKGTDGNVVILSNASRKIWVGSLNLINFEWQDRGAIYDFPSNKNGKFCNVRGVTWLDDKCKKIVVVSNSKKSTQKDDKCQNYEQAIHLFELP